MIGGNVGNEVDLEKLVKEFKSIEESFGFSIIVAFDDGGPVGLVGKDLASIKEALNNHNKIFVEIGFFMYHDVDFIEKPCFQFWEFEFVEDVDDSYYDKYHSSDAGFGIYVNHNLEVEYGYYVAESSKDGEDGYIYFHDFKDAREDDNVKKKIYKDLDELDIWK